MVTLKVAGQLTLDRAPFACAQVLVLDHNQLSDQGAKLLAPGLKRCGGARRVGQAYSVTTRIHSSVKLSKPPCWGPEFNRAVLRPLEP